MNDDVSAAAGEGVSGGADGSPVVSGSPGALFPGVDLSVKACEGFLNAHSK